MNQALFRPCGAPRRPTLALLLLLAPVLTGCFEDPVSEEVALRFGEGGEAQVTARIRITETGDSAPLARRLSDLRHSFERGTDAWTRRFEQVEAHEEERTLIHRREDGVRVLSEVRHAAIFDAGDLPLFFAGSNLTVAARTRGAERELLLVPGSGGSAGQDVRVSVERDLRIWSVLVANYLAEADRMYAYLEVAPMRAEPLFAVLFSDVTGANPERLEPLTGEEVELVERLRQSMTDVAEAAVATGGEAWNLNERSLSVYDPFPARMFACVEGEVLEVEGFTDAGDGCWEVPRRGALDSLAQLEGRWIAPDPLAVWLDEHRAPESSELDPAAFAARPRTRGGAPAPPAVRAAIEEAMKHEPAYRLRWRG